MAAVPTPDIVAIARSAAMMSAGQRYPVDRETLIELCDEILATRHLLERLGGDLRAVAAHARRPIAP